MPSQQEVSALLTREQIWIHVQFELSRRLADDLAGQTNCSLALWWACSDGSQPPEAVDQRLRMLGTDLARELGVTWIAPEASQQRNLEEDLEDSDLVAILVVESSPGCLSASRNALMGWNQRRWELSQPHQCTALASVRPGRGDGMHWSWSPPRFPTEEVIHPEVRSTQRLKREQRSQLGHWIGRCRDNQGGHEQEVEGAAAIGRLSEAGWQRRQLAQWAMQQGSETWQQQRRRLVRPASMLLVLVTLPGPALLGPRSLPLSLAILLAVMLLTWRRLHSNHRDGLEWWVLAQILWVQDCWHRFQLWADPLDRLVKRSRFSPSAGANSSDSPQTGPLWLLADAHRMHLRYLPDEQEWQSMDVDDLLEDLDWLQHATEGLLRRCRQDTWLLRAGLLGWSALLLLEILAPSSLWFKQAVLSGAGLCLILWMSHPLPAFNPRRLRRHLDQLKAAEEQLRDLRHGHTQMEASQRARVKDAVRRIGEAELDLASDGLEAVPW